MFNIHSIEQGLDQGSGRGFSLVELLMAMTISFVLMLGIYNLFLSQQRSYLIQDQVNEMNQNLRVVIDRMVREIRMTGCKDGGESSPLLAKEWSYGLVPDEPYEVTLDENPKITKGSNSPEFYPDIITFIYADNEPAHLNADLVEGSTSLSLDLSSEATSKKFAVEQIIYLGFGGSPEYAKIISISGNSLTIDTNPPDGQGFIQPHQKDEEVGIMNVVSFTVYNQQNDPQNLYHEKGHPVLVRKINNNQFQPLAENIELLKIDKLNNDFVKITIQARSDREDRNYLHPQINDHYHRRILESTVKLRNLSLRSS